MSNPTSVVTERKLGEFYQKILPYLGGSADAGFTPVGCVVAMMGVTAPANYLACNGQIVNVADYPELANYFEQQFGTKYKFGGSGTTFGIPDLRGEFLRGTGTNGHSGEGNGSAVGTHQDSTRVPHIWQDLDANSAMFFNYIASEGAGWQSKNEDAKISTDRQAKFSPTVKDTTASGAGFITIRPTNTSILWCIATKDIYLNPAMDYSTSEKVVGKWIDGSTIYQKTISCGQAPQAVTSGTRVNKEVAHGVTNIDRVVYLAGSCYKTSSLHACEPIMSVQLAMNNTNTPGLNIRIDATNIIVVNSNTAYNGIQEIYVTIQYTKTT